MEMGQIDAAGGKASAAFFVPDRICNRIVCSIFWTENLVSDHGDTGRGHIVPDEIYDSGQRRSVCICVV